MSDASEVTEGEPARPLPTAGEVKARLAQRTAEVERATEKRKAFLGLVRGSKLRVGVVQAESEGFGLEALVGELGLTVSFTMLAEILNGNLPVKDAESAAKVAKLGLEVHRALSMTEPEDNKELTPTERDQRRKTHLAAIRTLAEDLQKRVAADVERPAARPSPTGAPDLAIVPASPPVPAQEA